MAAVADGRRSSVPGALTVPSESARTIADRLPQDLLLVALLGLLMVFPAQIFNSTYEENHERIQRFAAVPPTAAYRGSRSRPPRTRPGAPGRRLPGQRGDRDGARRAPGSRVRGEPSDRRPAGRCLRGAARRGGGRDGGRLVVPDRSAPAARLVPPRHPSGLVVAAVCVLVSRLTDFAPGYLYGLLGGAVFAGALQKRLRGSRGVVTLLAGCSSLSAPGSRSNR